MRSLEQKSSSSPGAALALAAREGRARWPGVAISDEVFSAHVCRAEIEGSDLTRFGADLFLACGCLEGDGGALRTFQRDVMPIVERQLVRSGLCKRAAREDLAQQLVAWLLAGSQPRLARYRGRGPLIAWLKVVTSRRALRLAARQRPWPDALDEATVMRLAASGPDPELDATRGIVRTDLQRALDGSVTALSAHARSVLRMHYVQHMTLDDIALEHRVHRATVARWLAGIRTTISAQVRERLSTAARPSSSDFRSLIAAVGEELHLSLDRLLGPADQGPRVAPAA
jgi:RNA polymerase sigma-70 factor (ECF subfamily)